MLAKAPWQSWLRFDVPAKSPITNSIRKRDWKGWRTEDLDKKGQEFCWLRIHEAHFVGKRWTRIPGYVERTVSKHCDNVIESIFSSSAKHTVKNKSRNSPKPCGIERQSFWTSLITVVAPKFIDNPNVVVRRPLRTNMVEQQADSRPATSPNFGAFKQSAVPEIRHRHGARVARANWLRTSKAKNSPLFCFRNSIRVS